MFKKTRENSLR